MVAAGGSQTTALEQCLRIQHVVNLESCQAKLAQTLCDQLAIPARRPVRASTNPDVVCTAIKTGDQRREFHEALLDADCFEDLPGKWQAAILAAEQSRPRLHVVENG
jgi:hypothetical protein